MQSSSCPHCGRTSPAYPLEHLPNDVTSLQGSIHKLNQQIQQLNAHKASLLRQLNFIQSSTRNIPPENLSIVFQHLCRDVNLSSLDNYTRYMNTGNSSFDRNRSVIRLGAVSSLWRQVAWSTPHLWTSLIMTVQTHTAESSAAISQLALTNAKNFSVSLDLHFLKPSLSALSHLADVLFNPSNARKIHNLTLHNPPIEWMSPLSGGFSQLSTLTLKGNMLSSPLSPRSRREISLKTLSHLHHLTLRGIRDSISISPSSSANSITTLDLFGTPIHICARLLIQCPNLVECHCRASPTLPLLSETIIITDTTFPYLKILSWPLCEGRSNSLLLRHIHLPVLQSLRLYGNPRDQLGQSREVVIDFFARLPNSVDSIELVGWSGWSSVELAQQILCRMDSVRSLVLLNCFDVFPEEVVKALTPGEDHDDDDHDDDGIGDEDDDEVKCVLPNLMSLVIRSRTSRFVPLLVGMIQRRRECGTMQGEEEVFRIEVVTRQDGEWLPIEVERVEDVVKMEVAKGRRIVFEIQCLDSS